MRAIAAPRRARAPAGPACRRPQGTRSGPEATPRRAANGAENSSRPLRAAARRSAPPDGQRGDHGIAQLLRPGELLVGTSANTCSLRKHCRASAQARPSLHLSSATEAMHQRRRRFEHREPQRWSGTARARYRRRRRPPAGNAADDCPRSRRAIRTEQFVRLEAAAARPRERADAGPDRAVLLDGARRRPPPDHWRAPTAPTAPGSAARGNPRRPAAPQNIFTHCTNSDLVSARLRDSRARAAARPAHCPAGPSAMNTRARLL